MAEEESRIYQEISEKFKELVGQDKVIQSLAEKIASGKATYQDAWDYANRIGKAGSKAMLSQVDELVADGIDGYESIMESLYECYDASATYAAAVQTIQNKLAGIGIKGQRAEFDKDRASGIAHLGSNAEDAASAARHLGTPVEHFTENVVGDTIKTNEEFQYQSGLNPKIKRTSSGKCCEWCEEETGEHDYPAEDEVYRRHENCDCLIEYSPGNALKKKVVEKKKDVIENPREKEEELKKKSAPWKPLKESNRKNEGSVWLDGTGRREKWQKNWSGESLKETLDRFVPNASSSISIDKTKIVYSNGGRYDIYYDIKGDYFRILDNTIECDRQWVTIDGEDISFTEYNGKRFPLSHKKYEERTHFANIDKEKPHAKEIY